MSAGRRTAVLFDLDDTLYGYAPCNAAGLEAAHDVLAAAEPIDRAAFLELHDRVRSELAERLRGQAASHNRAIFFKRMVELHAGPGRGALALRMFTDYWAAFLERMVPAPGALETLDELGRTHALALVTNHTTDIQLHKVERLGIATRFAAIVTSEEVGVEKPHARVFATALEELGVEPARAVMVGDNPTVDVRGAAEAGMRAILSTEFRPPQGDDGGAACVVTSVGDVRDAVRALLP